MLISYVLDGGLHGHGMDELSELHLSHTPISFADVAGKGKEKITFDQRADQGRDALFRRGCRRHACGSGCC